MKSRIYMTAVPLLALAACGGIRDEQHAEAERTAYEELAIASDTAVGFRSPRPAPVVWVQGTATTSGSLVATGNFHGVADEVPPGGLTIAEESPAETRISVSIERFAVGTEVELSLVRGACEETGQPVLVIGQFEVPETGIAAEAFTVRLPIQSIADGRHSLRLSNPVRPGEPLLVLGCADLPAAPAV